MSAMRGDGGGSHAGGFGVGRHHDFGDDALTRFDTGVVRRLFGFVRPYRRILAGTLLAVALATAVQVSIPLTVRYAVDSAVGHSEYPLNAAGRIWFADWMKQPRTSTASPNATFSKL